MPSNIWPERRHSASLLKSSILPPSPSPFEACQNVFRWLATRPCGPLSKPNSDFRPRWNNGGLSACEGNGGSFKHLCILFMPCESHLIIPDSLAFLHLHLNPIHLRSSSVYLSLVHSLIVGQYDTSARRISYLFQHTHSLKDQDL
jgi:hypothetical protein